LLRTGRKFPVPFDGLVIFSTNLSLTDVADEGMLRRLHYKIEVSEPSKEDYAHILAQLCRERDIILPPDVVPFSRRTSTRKVTYPAPATTPATCSTKSRRCASTAAFPCSSIAP
jgi:hypothetical protein